MLEKRKEGNHKRLKRRKKKWKEKKKKYLLKDMRGWKLETGTALGATGDFVRWPWVWRPGWLI
jgi:hypothetical protein